MMNIPVPAYTKGMEIRDLVEMLQGFRARNPSSRS